MSGAVNLLLWIGGAALVVLAVWRGRGPYARMSELDRLAQNALRYESWRGGRTSPPGETTGAGVMRTFLRRQVVIWAAVGLLGAIIFVAGFAIR